MKGVRIVMPYDTYRLYQIERVKSPPRSVVPTSKRPGWQRLLQRCFVASRGPCER